MRIPPDAIVAVNIVLLVLVGASLVVRLWARQIKHTRWKAEDWTILAAFVVNIALAANIIVATIHGGVGKHIQEVPPSRIALLAKEGTVIEVLWSFLMPVIKVSVALFYKTLFPDKIFKLVADFVIIGCSASDLGIVLACFLICDPFKMQWDPTAKGHCGNLHAFWLGASIINLFWDVFVLVMPMPMLWGLQMKTSRKIGLTMVFGIGSLVCAITILRIVANEEVSATDETYTSSGVLMWTSMEPLLAILSANLPFFPAVFSPAFNYLTSSIMNSIGHSSNQPLNEDSEKPSIRDRLTRFKPRDPYHIPGDTTMGVSTNASHAERDPPNYSHFPENRSDNGSERNFAATPWDAIPPNNQNAR